MGLINTSGKFNLTGLVFQEMFESCLLPSTMRHGAIVLIPKPGKDPQLIKNHPLKTLRNCK